MKDEVKKINRQFNKKGALIQLKVKNRVNFATMISLMVLKCVGRVGAGTGAVAFDRSITIPKDMRQFLMALGINDSAFLSASDMVRPFLLKMGQSNPSWEVPQAVVPTVEREGAVRSPSAKKRKAPASSSKPKKKATPKVVFCSLINE